MKETNRNNTERTMRDRTNPTAVLLSHTSVGFLSLSFITFTHSLSFSPIVSPFILSLNEMSERMTVKE